MRNKTLIVIIIISIIVVAVGVVYYSYSRKSLIEVSKELKKSEETEGQKIVLIGNFAYSPKEITILKGETVVWTNKDFIRHDITSDSGNELDSDLLGQGETYSHTFNQVGEYTYHCTPHPFMKGKVVVQ